LLEKQLNSGKWKLTAFEKFRNRFLRFLDRLFPYQKPVVILYTVVTCGLLVFLFMKIGRDVLPKVEGGQFQVGCAHPMASGWKEQKKKQLVPCIYWRSWLGKKILA
jgi:multidrug efflux pump subunit AcrB